MLNLYEYLDFKVYLKDFYTHKKKGNKNFSYRYIAGKVGFKSAGQFTQILKGQLNLSQKLLPKFINFLKLSKKEAEYFELLVNFNQAKNQVEKSRFYERLITFKEVKATILSPDQYKFYQKWYYAAVRDILSIHTFEGNFRKLANLVEPSISTAEAREAIELLQRLGIIKQNDDGSYIIKNRIISSPIGEGFSTALANYATQMLDRAKYAVNDMPKEDRSVSWVGASLSKEAFEEVKEEITLFRNKILSIAEKDMDSERVYHFNIQCFPLSKDLSSNSKKKRDIS